MLIPTLKTKFFLTGEEISQVELLNLLEAAVEIKKYRGQEEIYTLKNKTIALIFEKPSLRTRLSFTIGIQELGGSVVELVGSQIKHEEPQDSIRVLQGMVHGLMIRTFEHEKLNQMAQYSKIPIINGLSDSHHPCQALADLLTLKEKFNKLKGLKLAYLGDGNNVLHSLLLLAPYAGVDVYYACPESYQPDPTILQRAQTRAKDVKTKIVKCKTPQEAATNAHALYTDVWTSMGFEKENEIRIKAFEGYQINKDLLQLSDPNAIVLHCLPMVREQEITSDVVESPASALFQQAENRLHAQKALLLGLYSKDLTVQPPKTKTETHGTYVTQ